jgi:DNA-binding winged helix-turn-helix (wHTH) protein/TolB-like protein
VDLIDNALLDEGFRLGDAEVFPQQLRIRTEAGKEERVEPGVMAVLVAIARRNGNLVSRDELVEEVWGRPTADGPIDRRIMLIRRALGDRGRQHRYVETLTKRGYRLLVPVEPLAGQTPASSEATPEERPAAVTPDEKRSDRRIPIVPFAAALLVVAVAAYVLWPDRVDATVESIAVLPFDNFSAAPGDEYLVQGFKEELVQTLHSVPGLTVVNVRSEALPRAGGGSVDTLLFGSLQRSGDMLKVSFVVENSSNGITLAADDVAGKLDDLFGLQEALARKVQVALYPGTTKRLVSRSRPANAEAYNEFLLGSYAFDRRGQKDNLEEAIRRFQNTIALDPEFGPAYLQLATAFALLPDYRGADLADSNQQALEAVSRGIAVDSNIEAAAGAVYGFVAHKEKRWGESRRAYERAVGAPFVAANSFNWYSRLLASVGDLDGSLRVARRGLALAPDSAVLNSRVAMAYCWLGENEEALRYFERANALGADGTTHLFAYALLLNRIGEVEQSHAVARKAIDLAGGTGSWLDPIFRALRDPGEAPAALEAVNTASEGGELSAQVEIVLRSVFGDLDGALLVAKSLEEPGEAFEMDLLYTPELRRLRERPEFEALMLRLGIPAYWQANGCSFVDAEVVCPG